MHQQSLSLNLSLINRHHENMFAIRLYNKKSFY